MPPFRLSRIALCPSEITEATELLREMGFEGEPRTEAVMGEVFGREFAGEIAKASFGKQGSCAVDAITGLFGENWIDNRNGATPRRAGYLCAKCSEAELADWTEFFKAHGIAIAQDSRAVSGERVVIFDTYDILSIDVAFEVRG